MFNVHATNTRHMPAIVFNPICIELSLLLKPLLLEISIAHTSLTHWNRWLWWRGGVALVVAASCEFALKGLQKCFGAASLTLR
jgi:hypothetical protein